MKKICSLLLIVILVLGCSLTGFASDIPEIPVKKETPAATTAAPDPAVTQATTETVTEEKTETKTEATTKKEEKKTETQTEKEKASSENLVSEDNPIGDNGAWYDLDGISGSPDITAESSVVIDTRSGYTLYSKQGDVKRYPASITKVMTSLIAIENCSMDETVEYTEKILNTVEAGSSSAGIPAGAKLSMKQSLYALMLASANEAGAAIACHIAGSDKEFAKLMTRRARELGCKDTTFKNPHGLPNEEHVTTAHDMALIMKKAMEYSKFRKIAGTVSYTIKSDTLKAPIELYNHARILQENSEYYYKNAKAAKTGFTRAALNTLVTASEKDDTGLICVILKDYGADRSYIDSRNLYRWAYDKVKTIHPARDFDLEDYIEKNKKTVDKKIVKGIRALEFTYDKDYPILVKQKFDAKKAVCKFESKLDKKKGRLGYINIYDGKKLMGSVPVTYDAESPAGKSFNNSDRNDKMKTANVNRNKVTPYKFLVMLAVAAVVLFIIFLLIQWKRVRHAEMRRKRRVMKRKQRNLSV